MLLYIAKSNDPRYNIALEEFLVKSKKFNEPILYLWQNDNAIIVGRNQNTAWEVNLQNAEKDGVRIVRRNSGGGTVFQDMGNMNFSIIYTDKENKGVSLFEQALEPVIKTLNQLGVPAKFSGRNDIELNGKKISGNAMWKYEDRFLQHGTLLFNANLDRLLKYLTVDRAKILSKNIQSVSARVTNINAEVEEKIEIPFFMEKLVETYKQLDSINELTLTEEDLNQIDQAFKNKFANPDWTFAKNADFSYRNKTRLEGKGSVEVLLNVEEGKIVDAKIYGDFLGFDGTEEVEKVLIGTKYSAIDIENQLKSCNIKGVFGENFTTQDILDLLIQ